MIQHNLELPFLYMIVWIFQCVSFYHTHLIKKEFIYGTRSG